MALTWYINRINITTYGCYVEGSSGLLDMPKAKTMLTADINDHHGESVNVEDIRYQGKDIILSCFCFASTIDAFNTYISNLRNALSVDGLLQLTIIGMTNVMSFMVICQDGFSVTKQWRASGVTMGTFQLKLYEPCPVKRILRYVGGGAIGLTIALADVSGRVYWGDGEYSPYDDSGTYTHSYAVSGTYYIVITGYINPLMTPNYGGATLIWEQLL